MHSWNQGYITDINYTKGYYGTLNPLRIQLCFLSQKILPPKINTACELGFGQGITLNFNAASANAQWYGTDFNASQAHFAQNLANISKAPLKVYNDSFEEFLKRDDLPQFDFIALHGIYSWVSEEIRSQIIEFLHKKLNIGGVCLISYNCQAGWSSFAPLRDFLRTYSHYLTPLGKISSERAKEGLNFINALIDLPCSDTFKNPKLTSVISTLSKMDSSYLSHELLNENHTPFNFLEISEMMGSAKMEFASYANFADHLTNIQLLPEEKDLLMQVAHNRAIYEMLKDLMFSTSFRSDYWAKGVIRLNQEQALEELLKLRIISPIPFSKVDYEIKTYRGNFKLNEDFYRPILESLHQNGIVTIGKIKQDLEQSLQREVTFAELTESLIALSNKDYIKLVQEEEYIQKSQQYATNLNQYILKQSTQSQEVIHYLLSPVTGEAISFNHFELLFLFASTLSSDPKEWIELVTQFLKKSKEKMIKDGKELSPSEATQELEKQAHSLQEWIPLFQKLKIL
ncbi:class I SAM-dependent methyltransferase [Helicobacter kayseriensis]|uniref:class I SAM-dependent methyltransferase n=1 Tax=Helicobacter kayseriensis TaxID=2905877 RepID=UPI001E416DD6|nr:class I SAM-dependent methyltransferase [Helicobacter kayseriensis]MCE3047611.1 class I SAM-dependent methyltransferase [Helicobacter kayseriensis]MCE3048982.1 class I SAM-dependent methyltransferase [Helicobacter kayseriensis]